MLVAITTEGKIGLGLIAGLFIVFALVASFVLPRRNPDFPGERLGLFVAVATLLFAATVAGVFVFAKEEEAGAHAAGGAETHAVTETGETETGGTETDAGTDTGETETETETETEAEGEGDREAGAEVFAANGCGSCHTFEEAESTGTVGPNLDEASPPLEEAVEVITNGRGAMPAFGDQLSEQQIRDVAAYVSE